MPRILFITLYDMICIGPRLLSSISKMHQVQSNLVIFKDQRTRPIWKDVQNNAIYQNYHNGIKHSSCYEAFPYTAKEEHLLLDLIDSVRPDLIGLSTRSFALPYCKSIFGKIRRRFPIPIIGGGWGPTLEPRKFLEFCDYVCIGEGEQTIVGICEHLKLGSTTFDTVPNLAYFRNGVFCTNVITPPLDDSGLNALPYPDFEASGKYLIDSNTIMPSERFYNEKIYNCFAGRGCPMSCTYCMSSQYRKLYKGFGHRIKKYRLRNVETVIQELTMAKRKGARFIRIADEVFPINRDWVLEFLRRYSEQVGLPFFAYVRPEFHSPDMIRSMVRAGLFTTIVGIQSGSEYIRKAVFHRFLSKDKIVLFAETLRDLGVDFKYDIIHYNPFEKELHLAEALEFLRTLPYAPLTVFKLATFERSPIKAMIDREKPRAEPDHVQKWYAYLFTMTLKSGFYRRLATWIYQYSLFRKNLFPLVLLFLPGRVSLKVSKLVKRVRYGSATVIPLNMPRSEGTLSLKERTL